MSISPPKNNYFRQNGLQKTEKKNENSRRVEDPLGRAERRG